MQSQPTGSASDIKPINLAAYLDRWLEDAVRQSVKKSTYNGYEIMVRVHIKPYLGAMNLDQITPFIIQNLYTRLEKNGKMARTRQLVHITLQKALNHAVKWGYLHNNPCISVEKPRSHRKNMKVLSPAEALSFLRVAQEDRLYTLFLLAITTGLRQGELFGLQWDDINFENQTLSVQRTVYELNGSFEIGEPKTGKSRRLVDLPEFVTQALTEHRQSQPESKWVFCDLNGGLLRRQNVRRRHLVPLLKKAGLPIIRFHDLRHTAATLLLSEGVHPKIVQERLGHSQISVTLDIYSHVLPSMQKDAAAKVDALFSDSLKPKNLS